MLLALSTQKFVSVKEYKRCGKPKWTLVAHGVTGRSWSLVLPRESKFSLTFELEIDAKMLESIEYFTMEAGPPPPTGVRDRLRQPFTVVNECKSRTFYGHIPLRVTAPNIDLGPRTSGLLEPALVSVTQPTVPQLTSDKMTGRMSARELAERVLGGATTTVVEEAPIADNVPLYKLAEHNMPVTPTPTPQPQPEPRPTPTPAPANQPVPPKPRPQPTPTPTEVSEEEEPTDAPDTTSSGFVFVHQLRPKKRGRGPKWVNAEIYYSEGKKKTPTLTLKLGNASLKKCRWTGKQRVQLGIDPYTGEVLVRGVSLESPGYLMQFQKSCGAITFSFHEELGLTPFEGVKQVEILEASPLGVRLRLPADILLVNQQVTE